MNHHDAHGFCEISITEKTAMPSHTDEQARLFDGYGLYYVTSGEGSFFAEGAEYPLSCGTAVLVRPLVCHSIRSYDTSRLAYREITFLTSSLSAEVLDLLDGVTLGGANARLFSVSQLSESVTSAFSRIGELSLIPDKIQGIYRCALLTEIIVLLSASDGEDTIAQNKGLGSRLSKYIDSNLTDNLSLDALSRAFFVSKYHLCRAFKAYNGISVHEYIIKKRVLLSKQLIEAGEAPSGVAYKVGFGDYSAFYRAYVKLTGKSPSADGAKPEKNGTTQN